ncbi:DUF2164 domain-containing protein [Candidatus Bipolaricaulota bacterium]|nr:DUF2164 domain-containing protein [Candidatus Bipolaricaulota bacterium]TFH10526.1 MAG: DUF2164 domain-containing protein [Candidatus Atribacteria bacterium]
MAIEFPPDVRKHLIGSIKQFFADSLDQDIGELKAALLLDFVIKEMGPAIYNGAVLDAQARVQEFVAELDGICFEAESGYWKK